MTASTAPSAPPVTQPPIRLSAMYILLSQLGVRASARDVLIAEVVQVISSMTEEHLGQLKAFLAGELARSSPALNDLAKRMGACVAAKSSRRDLSHLACGRAVYGTIALDARSDQFNAVLRELKVDPDGIYQAFTARAS